MSDVVTETVEEEASWFEDASDDLAHKSIFGIPEDIALVLLIDAILISLRVSHALSPSQFIGAKVIGTSFLIGSHFL